MGKKNKVEQVEVETKDKEGKNLLGKPTFKSLDNGRFKCVETGHELPAHAKDSYAETKHCRLGLIDSALARNKPPLNMFDQDPLSRSKLICKLTGLTVNKSEEHIWKHINGKRFLHMLEKKEAEKEMPDQNMGEESVEKPEKVAKGEVKSFKKKKKKRDDANTVISEVRNASDKDSDFEEDDFWMPPDGERWDFDDGGDRWGSDSDSGSEIDDDEATSAEGAVEEGAVEENNNDTGELSKKTKRMSIEIGPSDFVSRKKKKTKAT